MRILITTIASAAHYYPIVPFAWALRSAGHEVIVAAEPGFGPTVTQTGLPSVAVGSDVDLRTFWQGVDLHATGESDPQKLRMTRSMAMFTGIAEAAADEIVAFARAWRPDLVVFEARSYAGLLAAGSVGVPAIRHTWGLDSNLDRRDFDEPFLQEMFARHGLEDVDSLGALTVTPCPQSLTDPDDVPRRFTQYVPYNGPGSLPHWLLEPPRLPRVVVTWGHMFAEAAGSLHPINAAVEGLRDLPVEVLVAIAPSQRGLVSESAGPARVVEGLPLNLLLPGCAAVVNGGGAGTLMTALTSGVPMVIAPSHTDEPVYAERMSKAGNAVALDFATASAGTFRAAVQEILEHSSYGAAAQRLREENIGQPSPAETVAGLETWLKA